MTKKPAPLAKTSPDFIVIGGGLVGAAIAFGLQRQGIATLMLDEGDTAFRAARGNFGLIWVQSKGVDFPPYAQWTWKSAELWRDFNAGLQEITGDDLHYARPGGVEICLNPQDMTDQRDAMQRLATHASHLRYEILDNRQLTDLLPGLGETVAGGCYSPADGHVNPLFLLRALHKAFRMHGGRIASGDPVTGITPQRDSFSITTRHHSHNAARIVIAAGLGTEKLAELVGLRVPVRPVRGQNLITERVQPFLRYPTGIIRQTAEGSVQIGASEENVGLNEGTSTDVLAKLAAQAVRVFPRLQQARIVRAWGALRTMTPDGYPIYAQSPQHPGAFAATCHSGVTLAAVHALTLAPAIASATLPPETAALNAERFADATA